MFTDDALRILMVGTDINQAESLVGIFKAGGLGVRAVRVEDPERLVERLDENRPDVVLHTLENPAFSLQETVRQATRNGAHVPVIALSAGDPDIVSSMRLGAEDAVRADNREHLTLVLGRAVNARAYWKLSQDYKSSLREVETRCRTLLDSSKDPICYLHEGMHVYANDSYLQLFALREFSDLEGTPFMDMAASGDQSALKSRLRGVSGKQEDRGPFMITLKGENDTPFQAALEFSEASIEGEPCIQIVVRKRETPSALERQITDMTQRDPVTGLLNRKFFIHQLDEAISKAVSGQLEGALLLVKLTNPGEIRSKVGVSAFDTFIGEFAQQLETHRHEDEIIARFGDDTFCLLVENLDADALSQHMRTLWDDLSNHIFEIGEYTLSAALGIGSVCIDQNASETNESILRAERALTSALEGAGPHIEVYRPKQGEMTQRELDTYWENQITQALKEDRIRPVFQPIASLHGDPGERYELFLRLEDREGSLVSAAKFIPSAERRHVAHHLDRRLIETAVRHIRRMHEKGRKISLFLKLSAGALQDQDLPAWLSHLFGQHSLPPKSLVFELKEVVLVNHLKQARLLSEHLRNLKCGLAIDDFGTGLKPFQLLKAVSVDYLKMDRGLMRNIDDEPDQREKLRTMTETAHGAGKHVIAPFVENAATLSILWEIGVNYIQGSFIQEPGESMDYDFSSLG